MADISMRPGKLLADGAPIGICINCYRRTAEPDAQRQAVIAPPAQRDERGVWHCKMQWERPA